MEDAVSRSSLDSSSTGDEYVLVNPDPKLRITGDINDLNTEICSENQPKFKQSVSKSMTDSLVDREIGHVIPSSQSVDVLNTNGSASNGKLVCGHPSRSFLHEIPPTICYYIVCLLSVHVCLAQMITLEEKSSSNQLIQK